MIGEATARHLLEKFLGIDWPDGDPKKCQQAAEAWRTAADAVDGITDRAMSARDAVTKTSAGLSVDAFAHDLTLYAGYLDKLSAECRALGAALDDYAAQLNATRHQLIVIGEQVAADIAVTVAFGFLTAGIADLAGAGVLAMAGADAIEELSVLGQAVARIATTLSYYALDSVAYATLDQGGQAAVLALNGDPTGSLPQNITAGLQIAVANVGFDAAIDGEFAAVNRARVLAAARPGRIGQLASKIPADLTKTNIPVRAAARVGASSLAYSPILHAEQGTDLLPSQTAMEQKLAIHFGGRTLVDKIRLAHGG